MWRISDPLVLASASPRRSELLKDAKIDFIVKPSNIDESPLEGEFPGDMVRRLSAEKGRSVEGTYVLAADTTVVLDGENLGKPESAQHAHATLKKLQGNWHTVLGGIALFKSGELVESTVQETSVKMCKLSDDLIERYIKTGEPMDKAGSYAIQGFGAQFIDEIRGSYTNVVGLDMAWVISKLIKHGVCS